MQIKIVFAKPEQATQIKDLIDSRTTLRNQKEEGLVEYPEYSVKWYKDKIKNKTFLVALRGTEVVGATSFYKRAFLCNKDFSKDEIISYLLKTIKEDFVYFDVLVVKKEFENKGIGKKLLEKKFLKTKTNALFVAVSHFPKKKISIIKTLTSVGFKLQKKISVYKGLVFGIYKHPLNKK